MENFFPRLLIFAKFSKPPISDQRVYVYKRHVYIYIKTYLSYRDITRNFSNNFIHFFILSNNILKYQVANYTQRTWLATWRFMEPDHQVPIEKTCPNVFFGCPWKHKKNFGFLMFSEGGSKGNISKKWVVKIKVLDLLEKLKESSSMLF